MCLDIMVLIINCNKKGSCYCKSGCFPCFSQEFSFEHNDVCKDVKEGERWLRKPDIPTL